MNQIASILLVTITVEIDPKEYHKAKDTPKGAVDLVLEILRNQADWPDGGTLVIGCQGATKKVDLEVDSL